MAENPNLRGVQDRYTIGTILNQSPTTATLQVTKDWAGNFQAGSSQTIQPLMTGQFTHVNRVLIADRDSGAVVYEIIVAGVAHYVVFAWYNSFDQSSQKNAVFTDIIPCSKIQNFDDNYWAIVEQELERNPHKVTVTKYGFQLEAFITDEFPAKFNGSIVTLF